MPTASEPRTAGERPGASTAVLMLPGLWMPRQVMLPLSFMLASRGWHVERFGYPSLSEDLDENSARLAERVRGMQADRIHLVGHSLGAILVMRAIDRFPDSRIGRVVLLGPPYRDSAAGRALAASRVLRRSVGRTLGQWLREPRTAQPPRVPVGVIAGTVPMGLGRLVVTLSGPNDGAVTVAETDVPGANDRVVLPVSHSSMLVSRRVAGEIDEFLRTGGFSADTPRP